MLAKLVHVHEQLARSVSAIFIGVFRIIEADHAVRPVEQHHAVFLGNAHDFGDCLKRKFRCEVDNEVARTTLNDVVNNENRAVLEVLLEQADHAWREALVHKKAIARVLGRIGVEHHEAARVHALSLAREFLGGENRDAASF